MRSSRRPSSASSNTQKSNRSSRGSASSASTRWSRRRWARTSRCITKRASGKKRGSSPPPAARPSSCLWKRTSPNLSSISPIPFPRWWRRPCSSSAPTRRAKSSLSGPAPARRRSTNFPKRRAPSTAFCPLRNCRHSWMPATSTWRAWKRRRWTMRLSTAGSSPRAAGSRRAWRRLPRRWVWRASVPSP